MTDIGIRKNFLDFGRNIQIVAICTVLSIATGITGFIALIFIFIALGNIKKVNFLLNSASLEQFRSRYMRGFILRLVGIFIILTGGVNIAVYFIFMPFAISFWTTLSLSIILLSAGLIFILVGVSSEIKAWKNLKVFFENNSSLFPSELSSELIDGCDKLKKGTLLSALGFLVIPGIIGFIFQVIGFFKLAKLNTLSEFDAPKEPKPVEQAYVPKLASEIESSINFCPSCGSRLSGKGKFCALCGSEIN
ncbi:MAG: hypothetical protein ACTSQU_08380 [Promethearchaeota archaeon]